MHGFEVLRRIRARPASAGLPVLVMTGSGEERSVVQGLEAGANDYLHKPVRLDELVARVRTALRSHAAWSSAPGNGASGPSAATRHELQRILDDAAWHPVYQPIVALGDGATVGYEALTRFGDGTPPQQRLDLAAEAGLGTVYQLRLMETAVHGARTLPDRAFLSLNVAPTVVVDAAEQVEAIVARADRPVVLELTEHAPIVDYPLVREHIARLGAVGVAVDDAGAGYASLRHVLELRPQYTKLDMSLVRGIDGDELRQALASGIRGYAERAGSRLIAEGVESEAEVTALRGLGIELAQGFLLGPPARA
jgi:EAL domain-containing protein (putative c-di-GMP-specific phosphodiesterase class I)